MYLEVFFIYSLPVSTIQDASNRNSSIMSRIQNIGTPMMLPINQQQNNQINNQVVVSLITFYLTSAKEFSFLSRFLQPSGTINYTYCNFFFLIQF